jgi:hypothetical protein
LVIDETHGLRLDPTLTGLIATRRDGAIWLTPSATASTATARFTLPNGHSVTLILLGQKNAEHAWKIRSGLSTQLLITDQQAYVDGNVATLQNIGAKNFTARLIPGGPAQLVSPDRGVRILPGVGIFLPPPSTPGVLAIEPNPTKPAGEVAPLPADFKPSTRPRVVAAEPTDAEWSRAATWTITLPKPSPTPNEQHFLRIHYTGDVARISAGDHLLTDNFADGRPWLIGLTRFTPLLQQSPTLQLSIYPLRANPPIFFEPGYEPKIDGPQAASLQSVELVTQYTLKLRMQTQMPTHPTKKP